MIDALRAPRGEPAARACRLVTVESDRANNSRLNNSPCPLGRARGRDIISSHKR